MKGRGLVIAIDGPGGVGKSTLSRLIAERLGLRYVDTGAMYRAFALAALDSGVDIKSEEALADFCSAAAVRYDAAGVFVNGVDYSGRIRSEEAGRAASVASAKPPVRRLLAAYQRTLGLEGSVVMEGRDIGTVVLPDADVKFFLDAPEGVRAERRLKDVGSGADASTVRGELKRRDERDSTRKDSPLKRADDAILVETGSLDVDGVLEKMLAMIRERCGVGGDTRC